MAGRLYLTGYWTRDIPASEWISFAPPEGRCQVLMPGTPETTRAVAHGRAVVDSRAFRVIRWKSGLILPSKGTVFRLIWSDRDAAITGKLSFDDVIGADLDYVLDEVDGIVAGQSDLVLDGHPAREMQIHRAGGGTMVVRFYLVRGHPHDRLYILLVAGTHLYPGEGDCARFLDSFRLLGMGTGK
jgi:hypothetical protein